MEIEEVTQKFYAYSSLIKGYSKQTIRRYQYVLGLYQKLAGIKKLSDVSSENVRNLFFNGRTERQWSVSTFHTFHKSLSVFFKWCITQGLIQNNPVADLEKPKFEQQLPKRLTKQDALRLLEVVYNYPYEYKFLRYRNHALFSMFVLAGLRLNECLNLTYTDVDMENQLISVRKGKGNKDRVVPISSGLHYTLKRYLEERKRMKKTCPPFFVSLRQNRGFTQDGLKHLVVQLKKASGIRFSIHKLRHTFATLMIEGGCDIYSLSKMMGHSDIKTTTIYLSASVEHLRLQILKHPLN